MKFIVGIDEAGRGPLAGPVAVSAVKIGTKFNKKFFRGIKDSKKLTPSERELWFRLAQEAKRVGEIDYAVALISERVIDKRGINFAVSLGIKRCLKKIGAEVGSSQIFLDGGIKAPEEFIHQLTVIKGDEKIPAIALASICAKVTRDRYMVRLGLRYPQFGFDIHKGYGTLMHRQSIRKYGPAEPHRRSFLKHIDLKRTNVI